VSMSLKETIEADLHAALKAGDELKKSTLRMLKADIMTEKARTGNDPTEDAVMELVIRASKRRKEAYNEFVKANRQDLADKEKDELSIIEMYLPKQLTDDEVAAAIDAKIAAIGTLTQKDMGRIMGELMKELKGRTDGTVVKRILGQKIEGKQG
ncbi:MAG TPA: GatB/YqeY domain-containing protein, partial [Spirochaetota bacterium]